MSRFEQPDIFLEQDQELKDRFERAQFRVGLFGGSAEKESIAAAEELAYRLTKGYHTVMTGGYEKGVMGAGLKGAERAIAELREDSKEKQYVGQVRPTPIGVSMGGFKQQSAVHGRDIQSDRAASFFGRKEELITEPSAYVIFEGGMGSGAEVTDAVQYNMKLKKESKPMVFVGRGRERFDKLLRAFEEDIREDETKNYIHYVDDGSKAERLLELYFELANGKRIKGDMDTEELELLELTKPFRDVKTSTGKPDGEVLPVKFVMDVIVQRPDGNIAMIRRAKEPFMDKLCLAGGHLEVGETAREATQRELEEELDIRVRDPREFEYLGEFAGPYRDPRPDVQRISHAFSYRTKEGEEPHAKTDAREFVWVDAGQLKPEEVGFDHFEILKRAGLVEPHEHRE